MGTQVAAKQLLSFQNKAKDAVTKRKANERAAQRGNSCRDDDGDSGSDSDSDTDRCVCVVCVYCGAVLTCEARSWGLPC
jgi:hypothetical protein